MLLAEVVAASAAVAATRSRSAKAQEVARVLRAAAPSEVPVVTSWLAGEARQRKLGVGWRTLAGRAGGTGAAEPRLEVLAVDDALERLAATSGAGSAARREALLDELFAVATDAERSFLVRLVTGELRQGALEGVVLDAVAAASGAPAAAVRRAAMLSGSLSATAATALAAGAAGGGPDAAAHALGQVRLRVGTPVAPMLASPGGTVADALTALGADVVVEPKLDGARIQVHLDRSATPPVRVWTRTLREITDGVPEIAAAVLALPCEAAVLDGETLALDDDGRPRRFQDTMSRFGSAPGAEDDDAARVLLSPFFFDVLHVDGRDLLDEPLEERLAALDALLAAPEHAALRMPGVRRPGAAAAEQALAGALADGHEGVVVKDLASAYAAGRRGKAWQKVKPVHTLDLVVLAAEWGYGRRTGTLSNIHLGARDPAGGPPVMVGKTFKGMTDELLAWQTATFPQLAADEPRWGVVLRPELVVEVALDGAQRSSRYPGGVALRFARVLRYRPDKTAADADDLDAVRALLL
ncbi:ATP-dependent DNA ligase [Streptomyces sp. NP160]|uniref:ATP-dependent DNA ligase n=1 Tax=Streptomyces sp. NP160 TaxID=2586637 RepID=UPI0011190DA7|nr:ATP-dependent DNA ligase [Streptomyces sp. NP160]TNM58368.1 ATP-dependent DNA ligase [Streptomyces sp. NP160]